VGRVALALVVGATAVSCVDENIVYRNRDLFENPLPAALSFVGYSSPRDTLTVCGNCHVGAQGEWQSTGHAGAWETLQSSGQAQEFCEGCHTVNELGNIETETAGHSATGEERYYDVQCESCHGPGLDHINRPSNESVPLAQMAVDTLTGCGECHQGDHHPFVNQWAESGHGAVNDYPAGRDGCEDCHTGEGALRMFGVNSDYLEKSGIDQPDQHLAITCAVCHDPHGSEETGQLRYPVDFPSVDVNLCMQCHQKRGSPDLDEANRGPHSPEGPTLLGTAGWFPPGLESPILSTHGSTEDNPRLCAGCHVEAYEVTDEVTGDFVFNATGHDFQATPCVDAQGVPVPGPCENDGKTYVSCIECHSEEVARDLVESAHASVEPLISTLAGLLALVDPGEFDPDDGVYTVAEGAQFNLQLAETPGAVVHNVFLIRSLLNASITEVRNFYGLP
jgi:predicted CXXCH cytochrome family protein